MLKKLVVLFILISTSQLSFAQSISAKINYISFSEMFPGEIYVTFIGANGFQVTVPNPAACIANNGLVFGATWPFYKETISVMVTAKALQKTIKVTVSDTACTTDGFPIVTMIDF